ncbi:MAG: LTA synthase family protein [Candidatus Nomurabacteria bacterium]|jgi:phosphoglycerol transferase MdoB-like AlkP superfamily enzyme|nr:LTA synthase family protein [Candidatus Nomurabacteria bacterium]
MQNVRKISWRRIFSLQNLPKFGLVAATIVSAILMTFYVEQHASTGGNTPIGFADGLFWYSTLILWLISLILTSLSGSFFIGQGAMWSILLGVMFVSTQKMQYRADPLLPEDFMLADQAGTLAGMVDSGKLITTVVLVVVILAASIGLHFYVRRLRPPQKKLRHRLLIRAGAVVVLIATILLAVQPVYLSIGPGNKFLGREMIFWSQNENYQSLGFVTGFIYNTRPMHFAKPEGYSESRVQEIVKKYKSVPAQKGERVNIVYVMNESFSDPTKYLEDADDPIPNLHEVMSETTSGETASSEFGGGTANVEFEALTSFSNYYLDGMPYLYYASHIHDFPSIVSTMKSQNYAVTAIHLSDSKMYKREEVYKNFGFDQFIYDKDLDPEAVKWANNYISDETGYETTLKKLRDTDRKDFVFLLTMQNHVPYATDYLELLSESDRATANFLTELEDFSEKTLVVFWGDHLPGIYDRTKLPGSSFGKTPLFMWSNFEIEKQNLDTVSPIFFNQLALSMSGAKLTGFQKLMSEVYKTNKVLTKQLLKFYPVKDNATLEDYRMIEYDILAGKRYSQDMGFFE